MRVDWFAAIGQVSRARGEISVNNCCPSGWDGAKFTVDFFDNGRTRFSNLSNHGGRLIRCAWPKFQSKGSNFSQQLLSKWSRSCKIRDRFFDNGLMRGWELSNHGGRLIRCDWPSFKRKGRNFSKQLLSEWLRWCQIHDRLFRQWPNPVLKLIQSWW